jgi:hypothetical protein
MKFVFTMDMPSSQGSLVHQITGDHPAKSIRELWSELNSVTFIIVRQFYKDDETTETGEIKWIDKGEIILNTDKIGKVQIHGDKVNYDKPYRNHRISRKHIEGPRSPIRPSRTML